MTEKEFVDAVRPTLCKRVKKLHSEWRVLMYPPPQCDGHDVSCGHCDRTAREVFAAMPKSK